MKAAELNGLKSLKVKRTKREYSVDFKLDVVSYYLKSDEGRNLVDAKFNRKTYCDNLKRIDKKDKYDEVKDLIKDIYYNEGQGTYGYCLMWAALRDKGVKLAMKTVR